MPLDPGSCTTSRLRAWCRRLSALFRPLPHFLILGGMRCGTSTLYQLLRTHSQIRASPLKELHFFDLNHHLGVQWYRRQFPLWLTPYLQATLRAQRSITGEGSPYYLFDPRVPRRIAKLIPEAKLIVLLRDPVQRAWSHYRWERRHGHESLSFAEALRREPDRLAGEEEKLLADERYQSFNHRRYSYLARGIYADQLSRYFEHFPRQQILVIQSEEYYRATPTVFAQVLKFLGVDSGWRPASYLGAGSNSVREVLSPEIQQELRAWFAPHNRRLYELLGVDYGW